MFLAPCKIAAPGAACPIISTAKFTLSQLQTYTHLVIVVLMERMCWFLSFPTELANLTSIVRSNHCCEKQFSESALKIRLFRPWLTAAQVAESGRHTGQAGECPPCGDLRWLSAEMPTNFCSLGHRAGACPSFHTDKLVIIAP